MRELKRSIAKSNMRDVGFRRFFKPGLNKDEKKRRSPFARYWKEWIVPEGDNAKLLVRARARARRAAARGSCRASA